MSDAGPSSTDTAVDQSSPKQSATQSSNEQSAAPPNSNNEQAMDLSSMPTKARRVEYAELFGHESRIEAWRLPQLADDYPDFENEIAAAYLRFHTFRFKIYLNYDTAAGWFYTDHQRWRDCGKLVIGPKSLERLKAAGAHENQYSNVVLDISTHFRTIARITVEVRRSKLDVGPVIDTYVDNKLRNEAKHASLSKVIDRMAMHIQDPQQDFSNGKSGFNFADLEEVARCFQIMPNKDEDIRRGYSGYRGPWSTSWRNPGYLEHLTEE